MTTIRHEATVPLSAAGWRFDRALAEMFPDYSRSRLAAWIKAGAVTLDGAAAPPRQLLRGGEQVRLEAELAAEVELEPEDIALEVVHQDEHLLVLNKPAGLVVHPGAGNAAGTLLNALLHHDPKLAELPRGGIVHRLDKDTSGLMVVARSLPAHTALVDMLSRHEVERQYEAVVMGLLVAGGTVDAPIGRHMGDRLRQAVRDEEDGKRAVTHYRLRERFRAHALLQCSLETGRTHQIRVHMAHIGHPLVGDPLYGGGLRLPKGASPELVAALRGFRRQALHAERLAFEHPVSGEPLSFSAARPADLDALVNTLREDAAHADPYDAY
ncbi:23S rRNA pseudouridine(1911/1915/1917) synthase RluD [Dyella sp. LX-66]|uniref:23S rRNA pseudouridine(1911/1915/1917) synthase RluD n=1 Tax=unclassified Dyella TaxID=2634549 RepID=UPI001BE0444A|nr:MULTISPECIES: 23S rRNA pseudouridine(1911/1915/1917) synthase RluD [unclassified Dyella]MBT2115553.1 23S rRNA pseudouridine(1911/1915/1917) synthase RluD [Dyella sp. LX-1]MBT2139368.1 23S rRNA pseudouridine(1911/1915/1917) synthase RluD [Dyella sp. LX-66]